MAQLSGHANSLKVQRRRGNADRSHIHLTLQRTGQSHFCAVITILIRNAECTGQAEGCGDADPILPDPIQHTVIFKTEIADESILAVNIAQILEIQGRLFGSGGAAEDADARPLSFLNSII